MKNNKTYKISYFYLKLIIFTALFPVLFACNLTKNIPEGKHLFVKHEIQILNKNFKEHKAGFKEKDIEQILKPRPNSKLIWFPVPIKLAVYNMLDSKKIKQYEENRMKKCLIKKQKKISEKNKKLRGFVKKIEGLSSESKEYKRYVKKISRLQNRVDKINNETCEKEPLKLRFGEAPAILQENDKYSNLRKIRLFLQEKGYYNSDIQLELREGIINKKEATLVYRIKLEEVHRIGKVVYDIEPEFLKTYVFKDTLRSLLKIGKRLDTEILDKERERIEKYLRNEGFYNFSKDYIRFSVDTLSKNKNDVVYLEIKKAQAGTNNNFYKRYIVKNVYIYPNFDARKALVNKDAYLAQHDTLNYYDKKDVKYAFLYDAKPRINQRSIVKGIYIKPGAYFSLKNVNATYRYLVSQPIFQIANIKYTEVEDKKANDSIAYLDCEINMTQSKLKTTVTSFEVTNTAGNFGTGGKFSYIHKNFFKNTEVLNLGTQIGIKRLSKIKSSTQNNTSLFFNSLELGLDFSINFPRMMVPIPMKRFIKRRNTKTVLSANYSFLKRPDYTYTVGGGNLAYLWSSTQTITHTFMPVTADVVDLRNASGEFKKLIRILQLEDTYETHFVFGSSYRFTFNNQLQKSKKNSFFFSIYTKLVGNSLRGAMNLLNKETVDGSYQINNIVFAQFIKEEFELRYHKKLLRENDKLAFRLFAGAAYPYGNLKVMPFGERYYVGGASSLRAWQNRTLGPGSYVPDTLYQIYPNQTADIRLEANFEYRMKLFWKIEGALFADVGNIWAINKQDVRPGAMFNFNTFYKEIAVGTGFGFRLDLNFVLVRFDIGIKMIDPSLPLNNRWIYGYRKFGYNDWTLNFAIGYPF